MRVYSSICQNAYLEDGFSDVMSGEALSKGASVDDAACALAACVTPVMRAAPRSVQQRGIHSDRPKDMDTRPVLGL